MLKLLRGFFYLHHKKLSPLNYPLSQCVRKKNDLTQIALADALNISYQAVSNWERGLTMPDISKLPEISRIFNVSIDELLENKKFSTIIEEIVKEKELTSDIDFKDYVDLSPILKPSQLVDLSKQVDRVIDSHEFVANICFLDTEEASRLVENAIAEDIGIEDHLDDIIHFINDKTVDKLVIKALDSENDIKETLQSSMHYLSDELLVCIGKKLIKEHRVSLFVSTLPFQNANAIHELVLFAFDQEVIIDTNALFPFVSQKTLNLLMGRG